MIDEIEKAAREIADGKPQRISTQQAMIAHIRAQDDKLRRVNAVINGYLTPLESVERLRAILNGEQPGDEHESKD